MTKNKKCPIHNSYKCGCKSNNEGKYINKLIDDFILTYNRCYTLFTITNRRVRLYSFQRNINNMYSF